MYQSVDYPWDDDFDFAGFRQQVEEFFELLGTAQLRDRYACRWELISHLARLYASGTRMPPYSPFVPDEDEAASGEEEDPRAAGWRARQVRGVSNKILDCMGDDDLYYSVEWPDEDKVERTMVSDEMAWIYRDLRKGADEWDQGRFDEAAFTWLNGFEEGGWGQRCLSVLAQLHSCAGERIGLITSARSDEPESTAGQDVGEA